MKRPLMIGLFALVLALPLRGQEPLTHASQIRGLSRAEAAGHLPVKLRGTLTYFNSDWNGLFLQDETGAVYVRRHAAGDDTTTTNLQPGQILEVTGKTDVGAIHCDIDATALHVVGTGPLPAPVDLSLPNQLTKENERLRVKGIGQIFSISSVGRRPSLQLLTPSGSLLDLGLPPGSLAEAENLGGASIEFEGVLALELTPDGRFTGRFNVFATGMDSIRTIKSVPIVPIAKLVADGQPARIRAVVEELRPGSGRVRDSSGVVEIEYADQPAFSAGTTVEFFGYPEQRSTGLVMTRATASVPVSGDPALPLLTTIAKIRGLSAEEAARGFPIDVRGVVTFDEADSDDVLHFVQDGTAGIYVDLSDMGSNVLPPVGTSIELWGFTQPGGFAPVIEVQGLRVIGPGKFPNATLTASQLLMTGTLDSQWVELNGVVRSATNSSNRTDVILSTGDALIQMAVIGGRTFPSNFIGASIEASGVCRTIFDSHRQLKAIGICVPGWDQIEIKEAEAGDPFQLPPGPISGLFEFHAGGYGLNRSHIRGRIILRESNGAFFVQDNSGGILVQASEAIPPADWVDVVGFPTLKDQLPVLQDVLVRPAAPPAPAPGPTTRLSPDSALDEAFNATLVTLDGRVLSHSDNTTEETVTVQFGQRLVDAIMERSDREALPEFAPNSTVRFTGVYVARLDNNRQIQSFQVLLRSPADAVVVSVPPWWTTQHALYVFGGLGGVLLLALAWVAGLRRQVRRRTIQLRAEIEDRKRIEAEMEKTHREMMAISRQAGMAEVATSVLHNVGNVLNSVNVSTSLIADKMRQSKTGNVVKVAALIREHEKDLGNYLANDPKGRQLPEYLVQLAEHLTQEQGLVLGEIGSLVNNVVHIKEIVAMQQSYAKTSGVLESFKAAELVEDALRMNSGAVSRHNITINREFGQTPAILTDKHKVLQILVNLIRNAKYACDDSGRTDKQITLKIWNGDGRVKISVVDNGVGIVPENLTRIFNHGFTTRKDGHGFGLHSGANAAKELGGKLMAFSEGSGRGATFTLELPAQQPKSNS